MNLKALKENLHQQIDKIKDEIALETLHEAAVEYNKQHKADILDDLSSEQLQKLALAIKGLNEGHAIPNEEVMAKAKEWVRK